MNIREACQILLAFGAVACGVVGNYFPCFLLLWVWVEFTAASKTNKDEAR